MTWISLKQQQQQLYKRRRNQNENKRENAKMIRVAASMFDVYFVHIIFGWCNHTKSEYIMLGILYFCFGNVTI